MDAPVVTEPDADRLVDMLGTLPYYLREDPLVVRLYRAILMEQLRLERAAELVRDAQLPSRASIENGGLAAWEEVMGIQQAPDATPEHRRATLDAYLLARDVSSSERWKIALERLTGGTQLEITKTGTTVEVRLPAAAGAVGQAQLRALLARIVPAHLGPSVSFISGFIVDISHIDVEAL